MYNYNYHNDGGKQQQNIHTFFNGETWEYVCYEEYKHR